MKPCYHCGEEVLKPIELDGKLFCCNGCKTVYQLLENNGLHQFYDLESQSGIKPSEKGNKNFSFLDVPEIRTKFIDFEEKNRCSITLFLPSIHCSSCIYLLENINKINPFVLSCSTHFTKREATILFDSTQLKLSELAALLDSIGYTPNFGERTKKNHETNKRYLYKLGVAGFAFGSIMLWSFPEYLGIKDNHPEFRKLTTILSFIVSLPVLFYSANEYLISAWKVLRSKSINLDVPISLGIIALYSQSIWTMLQNDGPGYMDSFAAFIFFLLIGKWFQSKTYQSLSYDRDYTSFFPIAVERETANGTEIVEIEKLVKGDVFIIRNEEVIPCDAQLLSSSAEIDYSFVTGESELISKKKGDAIYAGGKNSGALAKLVVQKPTNRSHLTQLWNLDQEKPKEETDKFSLYFLIIVILIAAGAFVYWQMTDASKSLQVMISVLIVACPCAIALSKPFTYGSIMRRLGKNRLYLKNTSIIAPLTGITDIIFDKTGTLTTNDGTIVYAGGELEAIQWSLIYHTVNNSTHPYSKKIALYIRNNFEITELSIDSFVEHKGKGIEGEIDGKKIKIGSSKFVAHEEGLQEGTHLSINNEYLGGFSFESNIREGLDQTIQKLTHYNLHVLSGDSDRDSSIITSIFPKGSKIHFHQTPQSKMEYVDSLMKESKKVLMIGDGLNDIGALNRSTVGIAISEDISQFSPAADAIIDAKSLIKLKELLSIAKLSKRLLAVCLFFSIIYNVIGLSFALQGELSPLIAAILMPISSVTIVFIATFGSMVAVQK